MIDKIKYIFDELKYKLGFSDGSEIIFDPPLVIPPRSTIRLELHIKSEESPDV